MTAHRSNSDNHATFAQRRCWLLTQMTNWTPNTARDHSASFTCRMKRKHTTLEDQNTYTTVKAVPYLVQVLWMDLIPVSR